jgi:hypothetical protein
MNTTLPDENPEERAFIGDLRRRAFSPVPDAWRESILSAATAALPLAAAAPVSSRSHRSYRLIFKAMAALWAVSFVLWADTLRLGTSITAPESASSQSLHIDMVEYEETARLFAQSPVSGFPYNPSQP